MPGSGQRAGLRLPVTHYAGGDQGRVVHHRAKGVGQGVAQLAPLVDGAGGLGGAVAADAAGEGELAEQAAHTLLVLAHVGVKLAVGSLQIGLGHHRVAAVAGAGDIDHVQLMACDYPVQVGVDKVLARHRAPVAHQGALEVLGAQWLPQQRVVQQVELSGRQVVGGAPVGVQLAEHVGGQRALFGHAGGGFNDHLRLFLGGFCQSNDLLVSAFVLLIITDGTILSIEWGQNPS